MSETSWDNAITGPPLHCGSSRHTLFLAPSSPLGASCLHILRSMGYLLAPVYISHSALAIPVSRVSPGGWYRMPRQDTRLTTSLTLPGFAYSPSRPAHLREAPPQGRRGKGTIPTGLLHPLALCDPGQTLFPLWSSPTEKMKHKPDTSDPKMWERGL